MRYFAAIFLSLLSLIGLRQLAQADTTVNVSNTTSGGSNTHVVVNSNVNQSSTTTNNVNSHTQVHIENNGEVKDFNSDGNQSVNWQSSDGKSSVKINANGSNTPSNNSVSTNEKQSETVTPALTITNKPASPSVSKAQRQTVKKQVSLFHRIINWLLSIIK